MGLLQFDELNAAALAQLEKMPATWASMAELEALANDRIVRLRASRRDLAPTFGVATQVLDAFDRFVRTDRPEHLDEPDFPEAEKLKIVRALHVMNLTLRTYPRFLGFIRPLIAEVNRKHGRPARVLELASGAGDFALSLAAAAKRRRLPVEITGSDIVKLQVERANRAAARRKLDAKFRIVNAFDMTELAPGSFDIIFIAQSTHHFSAGQLAMMIAQSRRVATTAFVSADGYRSFPLLAVVPGMALPFPNRMYFHDAFVTSRKFYSHAELAYIARLAAPDAAVGVRAEHPGYSVLTVRA